MDAFITTTIIICVLAILILIIYSVLRGGSNGSGSKRNSDRDREVRQAIGNERDNITKFRKGNSDITEQLNNDIGVIRKNNKSQGKSNNRIREIIKKAKDRNNS
jgi:hypothetical protein